MGRLLIEKSVIGDLFADDIVLLTPIRSSLKNLLSKAHDWFIKNKMTFCISKCASLVIKTQKFISLGHYENPTFKLDMKHLHGTKQYTCLEKFFSELLDLEPIITKMNIKINYMVNSFFRFLTNWNVPFYFKTHILVSFVLSQFFTLYLLLESNKKNTEKA